MTKSYLQLAREIATLQAAADKQLAAEKKEAVARLNETIAKYELSAADLKFPGAGASAAKPGPKVKSTSKSAVSGAKYADGTGNTWGGRGPRPAWLRNAIAAGKSLESFAGSVAPAAQPLAATASASATAVPGKKAGFTVAPKYRHPGSGDTWSGRGSAPRWLKEALRKRGTKLDDFLIAKPAGTISSGNPVQATKSVAAPMPKVAASTRSPANKPVASAKAAPVKAPAAKKALASKTPSKKALAGKKMSVKKSTKAATPAPVAAPAKTPAVKKQAATASQRVATKTSAALAKPPRKAVTAKKAPTTKSAPAAKVDAPSESAPSVSSSASETSSASPAV